MNGNAELQAICEVCMFSIADGEGAVWIQPPTAPTRPTHVELDRSQPAPGGHAGRATWHVTHDECDHPRIGYRIEVERIRTWAAYLHWTGHLMSKDWIGDTNWSDMVLDSLNPTSTTTGGIRPLILRDPGHRYVGD